MLILEDSLRSKQDRLRILSLLQIYIGDTVRTSMSLERVRSKTVARCIRLEVREKIGDNRFV
jgi:hypothetical protein